MLGGREADNALWRSAQAGSSGSSKTVALSMPLVSKVSRVEWDSSRRLVPNAWLGEGNTAKYVVITNDVSRITITKSTSTVLINAHHPLLF